MNDPQEDGGYMQFSECLSVIPLGYSLAHFAGKAYGVTRAESQQGKAVNLQARELGGSDYISFNFYRLRDGKEVLKPCEMPEQKVIDFVLGMTLTPQE